MVGMQIALLKKLRLKESHRTLLFLENTNIRLLPCLCIILSKIFGQSLSMAVVLLRDLYITELW